MKKLLLAALASLWAGVAVAQCPTPIVQTGPLLIQQQLTEIGCLGQTAQANARAALGITGPVSVPTTPLLGGAAGAFTQIGVGTGLSLSGSSLGVLYGTGTGTALQGSLRGAASGVASLDGSSLVPLAQIPVIPATQTSGFGSIATQSAGAVAITGGAIDGAAIGGATPAAGAFTTLSAFGLLTGNASVNIPAGQSYQFAGTPLIQVGAGTVNLPYFFGSGAGANFPLSDTTKIFAMGFGYQSLSQLNVSAEDDCFGDVTCQMVTNGGAIAAFGHHAVGEETTGSNIAALGNDVMRNSNGSHDSICAGTSACRNGAQPWNVAFGTQALEGNSGTITITGSPTTGDVITLSLSAAGTSPGLHGLPATVTYTVVSGDTTLALLTTHLLAAINSQTAIADAGVGLKAFISPVGAGPTNVIAMEWGGTQTTGWQVTITPSVSGAATETLTVTPGSDIHDSVAIGLWSLNGVYLKGGSFGVIGIGSKVAPYGTLLKQDVFMGRFVATLCDTCKQDVVLGDSAGQSMVSTFNATFAGFQAGQSVTGNGNSIFGAESSATSPNCITSGINNLEIGQNACVPSPTANGQMSIQNAIYGTGNQATDYTTSTGKIGFFQPAPGARVDILGSDALAATLALRVQNSALANLLTVADDGIVQIGLSNLVIGAGFRVNLRLVASGTTDTAAATDQIVGWNSSTTGAKAQTIPACSSSIKGQVMDVKDDRGTAGTDNITVTPASGTIDGAASYPMNQNYQENRFICDGGTNWMVF